MSAVLFHKILDKNNTDLRTIFQWRPSFSSEGLPSLTQEDAMRVSKAETGAAITCHQSYGKMVALMQSLMGDFDLPKDTEQIQVR